MRPVYTELTLLLFLLIYFLVPKNVNFLQTMLTSAKIKEFWEYKVYFLKLHMWFVRFRKDLRFRNYKIKVFSIILTSFNKGELGWGALIHRKQL